MRIAINTRFLISGKLEGIGIYTQEIIKRTVRLMPEHEFYFLFDRPYSDEFIFADNVTPLIVSPPARHPFLWYWWFEHAVPKIVEKYNIDLFFSPDGFCSLNTKIDQIITVHDLGFEHFSNHVPLLVEKYYRHFSPKYCAKAQKILAVSAFTKQDIIRNYQIDEKKIDVVYNGFEKDQWSIVNGPMENLSTIDNRLSSKRAYFIFIGAVHPRKNVLGLLKAFEEFKSKFNQSHQLLIIGRKAWLNSELEAFYAQMTFREDVIWIEKTERNELLHLLQNAFALVYPSWFEGFGIPLLEAMHLGVPIITSTTSAMPEIAGNAAILVDPGKVNEIADAMNNLITDSKLRIELIENGLTRAKLFDWNASAKKLVNLIREFEK